MKFYKTIAEKGELTGFAVNDEFNKGTLLDQIEGEQAFYWNKKVNALVPGAVDLKDIFNFYRTPAIEDLAEVFSNPNLGEYFRVKAQLQAIMKSYKITRVNVAEYGIRELLPERVLKSFFLAETAVLQDAYNFLQEKPWCQEVVDFFASEKCATDVLTQMSFPITTLDRTTAVNLTWQANFRFRSVPGYLNLFNMKKEERYKIVPQKKFNMLYYADFRQFEPRTFCMIHPELHIDFSNRELYATLAERLNLDPDDAKRQIIAYGYGQQNEKLDKVLNRNAILEQIKDDFYSWNGYPVILRPGDNDRVKIHTIVQTIAQYKYLEKLRDLLKILAGTNSKFMYPLHDAIIISLDKDDEGLISKFEDVLEDDVYKVQQCLGHNLAELKDIEP